MTDKQKNTSTHAGVPTKNVPHVKNELNVREKAREL